MARPRPGRLSAWRQARHDHHPEAIDEGPEQTAVEFWDNRYGESDQIWSGEPNRVLVDLVADLPPGRALDLGAGEGGDSIWLAERGWTVTAVDISATALARAKAAAHSRGLTERVTWQVADLAAWVPEDHFDLVSAFFLHSPVEFPRAEVLRRIAGTVVSGGHFLLVGHAEQPPLAPEHEHPHVYLPGPDEEIASLALDPAQWQILIAEVRERQGVRPDGEAATWRDSVVLARRR